MSTDTTDTGWRSTRWWRHGRWVLAGGTFALVALVAAIGVLYATVELPADPPTITSTKVLAADGSELAVFAKDERRFEVSLDQISDSVVDALVAAEDRRFWNHSGVDPVGLARAVWSNVRGNDTQGGSTITQQLAKNTYTGPERTMGRKVREALLAAKLERRSDKTEILEAYLNTVYFGRGAYGIEAAAGTYFDTTAAELSTTQAALLVALLRSPENTDPELHPDVALERRNGVLDAMVETEILPADDAETAKRTDLGALPRSSDTTLSAGIAPHFIEWVRQESVAELGEAALYGSGLTIHTTLDPAHQAAAEASVAENAAGTDADASLISVDTTGAVTAHVGSRNHEAVAVDLARGVDGGGSGRQPGSAFKPFVLAAALGDGTTLGTRYPSPGTAVFDLDGEQWEVSNYDGTDHGPLTLADATARSSNTVYARLAVEDGADAVATAAAAAGISSDVPAHPSVALGTAEVSPLEMAVAYTTYATSGRRVTAHVISRVEDADGTTIWEPEVSGVDDAVDEVVADTVTHALRDVIDTGTGTAADIGRPAAGKTGTTQGHGDAWFAGYTPHRSTVVWFGHPEGPQTPVTTLEGAPVTGGGLPAQTWAQYMAEATAGDPPDDFTPPPKVMLLAPPPPERTLALSPDRGPAGTDIVASGDGYEDCTAGWWVTLDAAGRVPPPETDAEHPSRTAQVTVGEPGIGPGDPGTPPGEVTVTAHCDDGIDTVEAATATFVIEADPSFNSTTTSTTTTVPTRPDPQPERTSTTTTTTTTEVARTPDEAGTTDG